MILTIEEAHTIDAIHHQLVRRAFIDGKIYTIDNGSYIGHKRLQLDYVTALITNPGTRPLAPIFPPTVDPVTSDSAIVKYFMEYLWSPEKRTNESYTYGEYIYYQIEKIIENLKNGSWNSNQHTINIGDKLSIDLEHPPCLRCIDIKVRDGLVAFHVYFRSWDCWAGLPENLGGLQLLKEYLCASVGGLSDGSMVLSSAGLHMYDYQWPQAYKLLGCCLPENSILTEEECLLGERWMLK